MAGAHRARAFVSFILSEFLEEDVVKNESEDELEGLAALFFFTGSITRAVEIELITQVTRKYQFFEPAKTTAAATNAFSTFQPSLMRVEKVEQPNQPKTVFCQ